MEPQKTASIIKTLSPNEKKKKEYKKNRKKRNTVCVEVREGAENTQKKVLSLLLREEGEEATERNNP